MLYDKSRSNLPRPDPTKLTNEQIWDYIKRNLKKPGNVEHNRSGSHDVFFKSISTGRTKSRLGMKLGRKKTVELRKIGTNISNKSGKSLVSNNTLMSPLQPPTPPLLNALPSTHKSASVDSFFGEESDGNYMMACSLSNFSV